MIRRSHSRTAVLFVVFAAILLQPVGGASQSTPAARSDVPVLAYYYIWFTPSSWDRAKTDLPLLGTYDSDDPEVMRQHVRWAKEAGIDGFIVSWKNTEVLSPRLEHLVNIAHEEDFKLAIIYEALDFYRHPLPIHRVNEDFTWFEETYGKDPVFDIFGKPMIIWSGTWKFSREEIEQAAVPHRQSLLILASERQPDNYEDIADLVDGNAYYWSSVDPETFPDYAGKLQRMKDVIHANGGLWIAPVAPGFDARHLGGEREVSRRDGKTMQTQYETAMLSSPNAIGLISWNEFSENSHVEPSCLYGDRYLMEAALLFGGEATSVNLDCDHGALATAQAAAWGTPADSTATPASIAMSPTFDWDSSAPQGQAERNSRVGTLTLLGLIMGLFSFSIIQITRRALKEEQGA